MRGTMEKAVVELLENAEHTYSGPITQAQVLRLPEPIQRYLNYAQVVGKEPVHTIRLKQQGAMRTQPGQKWLPLHAEQYFTTMPPAFLWHCTMRPFPFAWITATDRFSGAHGAMTIKLLSLLQLGDERGPEVDQGELQRFLAEMIWFPTAWLSDAIEWVAIDAHSAQATLHSPGVTASVILHINEQGQPTLVTTDRYMSEHGQYRLVPWSGRAQDYREVDGMQIPASIEVTWHLASGEFTWFRVKLTEIEYNLSGTIISIS